MFIFASAIHFKHYKCNPSSLNLSLCVSFADVSMRSSCAPPQREAPASKTPPKSPKLSGQCAVPTARMWPSQWPQLTILLSLLLTAAGRKVPQGVRNHLLLWARAPTDLLSLLWPITMVELIQSGQTSTNTVELEVMEVTDCIKSKENWYVDCPSLTVISCCMRDLSRGKH